MSWAYVKQILGESEEVLLKLGAVISLGLFILEVLRRKLRDLKKRDSEESKAKKA